LITLIVTSVLVLISLLTEAKVLGEGDYGFGASFIYVLMHLPIDLYHFSPLLILLGSVIGLSILTSHRELAVMRSSGFSIGQIIQSVLFAALLLIVLLGLMGEWLGPGLSYRAEIQKENAKHPGEAVVTSSGIWFHIENNFIHVQHVMNRQLMKGVTRYQFDDTQHLLAAYYAETLANKNNVWQLNNVVKTSFYDQRTKNQVMASLPLDLKLNSNLLNVGLVDPNEMSLSKLAKFSHYLEQNGLQAREYRYSFWQRVFQPLASLVMIFLAIPFVLSAFSTSSLGFRVMMGVMVGFAFFILNAALGQLSVVYQLPTVVAALLPPLLFALLAVFLSKGLIRR